MFSVYNDFVNNKVYIMNYNGDIIDGGYEYEQTQFNLSDSREAKADRNYDDAANADNEGMPNEVIPIDHLLMNVRMIVIIRVNLWMRV